MAERAVEKEKNANKRTLDYKMLYHLGLDLLTVNALESDL